MRKINEQRLKELGVAGDTAKRLFLNSAMTLSYETRLIAALHVLKLPGSADRVAAAAASRHEREALFHVESAELVQQRHAKTPFTVLLSDSLATVAATADHKAVLLLPLDWVRWTSAADSTVREIASRARQELKATNFVIMLTGKASARAAKELAALGWSVTEP